MGSVSISGDWMNKAITASSKEILKAKDAPAAIPFQFSLAKPVAYEGSQKVKYRFSIYISGSYPNKAFK